MKKIILIFGFITVYCAVVSAQTTNSCQPTTPVFVQKQDGTGAEPYDANKLATLELVSKDLLHEFPESYCNTFKVYDYGFSPLTEYTTGSYAEAFLAMQSEARTTFYLLFARQVDAAGKCTKIWVDVNLPLNGRFGCMTALERELVKLRVEKEVNVNLDQGAYIAEQKGIDAFRLQVKKIVDCCAGRDRTGETCNLCTSVEDNELFYESNEFTSYEAQITKIAAPAVSQINYSNQIINLVGNVDINVNGAVSNTQIILHDFLLMLQQYNVPSRLIITKSEFDCTVASMDSLRKSFEDPTLQYAFWINIGENKVLEKIKAPFEINIFGNVDVNETLYFSKQDLTRNPRGEQVYEFPKRWVVSSTLENVFDNFSSKSVTGYQLLAKYARSNLKFGNSKFISDGEYSHDNVILEIIDREGGENLHGKNDPPSIIFINGTFHLKFTIAIYRNASRNGILFNSPDFQCTFGHEMFIHFNIHDDRILDLWRKRNIDSNHFDLFEKALVSTANIDHCGYANSLAKYNKFNLYFTDIKNSKVYNSVFLEQSKKRHDDDNKFNCKRGF
ncbi:MAG: hypothetical protein ACOYOA_10910 [Saprospiraceae bacterium]